ncbi:unnamed protein product, partial [Prorocentrum cordatum]
AYPIRLSPASPLDGPEEPCIWVDLELRAVQGQVLVLPKNPNRPWLQGLEEKRAKSNIIEWPGLPPRKLGMLVSLFTSRYARAQFLSLTIGATTAWALELVLELILLHYPFDLIIAAAHATPWSVSAQRVRAVLRVWRHHFRHTSATAMSSGGRRGWHGGSWNYDRGYDRGKYDKYDKDKDDRYKDDKHDRNRDRDRYKDSSRDRQKRSHSDRPSEKAIEELRKSLAAVDKEYAAYQHDLKCRQKETELRNQGEYVAAALRSAFTAQTDELKKQLGPRECPLTPRAESPTPPKNDEKKEFTRAELGWLQAVVGTKTKLPATGERNVVEGVLVKALKDDKVATANANKVCDALECAAAHMKRHRER